MTDYSKKIIHKVQESLTKGISEDSILYALVLLNKAIQDSYDKSKFPTINLYRDWLVHTNLDRNRRLDIFFKKWDEIIDGIGNGKDKQNSTDASIDSLELSKLFNELSILGINVDSEQKNKFVIALVNNLIDAPLRWNGKHIKEFRFTYDEDRKNSSLSYVCHMQIQHTTGRWFNGPELHFTTSK